MADIGVDWGSSSFRAYRYGKDGEVLSELNENRGILRVKDSAFEATFFDLLGDLVSPGDTVLLSGMITSRNGWIETPYAEVPVNIEKYLSLAIRLEMRGVELIFLPGVSQLSPPDVIRGEELQIFGICQEEDDAVIVLPGTHSKWVRHQQGGIQEFQTVMTGEVYDLLLNQSLAGMLAKGKEYLEKDYIAGLQKGIDTHRQKGSVVGAIFTARSASLLGQLDAEGIASYLSGILIGNEIASGLDSLATQSGPIHIVGSQLLCERYAKAFDVAGFTNYTRVENAAARGFSRIAMK